MPQAEQPVHYLRYTSSTGWAPVDARVITEADVALFVNGEVWLRFHCTPGDLKELAVGFLYNEGIIQAREEVVKVDICAQQTNVDVWLNHAVERPKQWQRTSGCTGGLTSAEASKQETRPQAPEGAITAQMVMQSMELLLQSQELYRTARGVHCSILSNGSRVTARAEDIGRHNTLDKLAGRVLLEGISTQPVLAVTTGRVSSEMLQKSARLGALAVISRTSPTSQSVAMAEQMGITLVGYARRGHFLVYTHPERLRED